MISGSQLLPILIGAALGAGGWMVGRQGMSRGNGSVPDGMTEQLRISGEQLAMLEKENAALRSLAQGGGEVSVPQEMLDRVEKEYGMDFLASPTFHRIASEELGYRVEAAIESRLGPQGIDDRQEAWRLMGFLREGDQLLQQLAAVKSVGVSGWFDEGSGEAWVTDRFDPESVPDQAAMLRLLTRILLNQHFSAPAAYPGDDSARAREAVHEGAAAGAEARYYSHAAQTIGFLPTQNNSARSRLLLALPEFVQGLAQFPTTEGRKLTDTTYVKGTEEFSAILRTPPKNTYGIVLPGETGRGGEVNFPEMEEEIYLKESAGYLGLRHWVSETGDHGLAEIIARDWVKDGYLLFGDGEMSSALVWKIELESEKAAKELESIALARISATVRSEFIPIPGSVTQEGKGRFLRAFRKEGKTLVFINAATKRTAEKDF